MEQLVVKSIATSFVYNKMKFITDKGSGEGKLFIGGNSKIEEYDSFFEFGNSYTYKLDKQNILEYLHEVKIEFVYQFFGKYQEANINLWNQYYEYAQNLNEQDLILNLVKQADAKRYYIDQEKKFPEDKLTFKNFIRKILVPKLTDIVFEKYRDEKIIILKLNVNYQFSNAINETPITNLSPIFPIQKIFYGVPGSGKSHRIDSEIEGKILSEADRDFQTVRVVFHPDYTNADFVGQILPVTTESGIKYEFKPGAFSKILWRAYHNPEKTFYLVVEEINRGNAAAIFGDIFQLLDRKNDGWSKYFVENDFINNYLRSPVEFSDRTFNENHENSTYDVGDFTFSANSGIRLPPNLSILATMNTSDQNVFTLDNAFQRRWSMELVPNNLDEDSDQYKLQIGETGICWGKFRKTANEFISKDENNATFSSMEDSRLGSYFIQAEENNSISIKSFAEKVLKYLWDDAFKMNREQFFRITDSFESIVNEFLENKSFASILNDDVVENLKDESDLQ